MNKPAISVRGLSKQYSIEGHKRQAITTSLKQTLKPLYRRLKGKSSPTYSPDANFFWALKDINFDIYPGERVGIIGRNGAGKSTLLKILSRLVYPTVGEAIIRGRVTSLLEVGTGFNPNLSGRENIYLNASLHGLKRDEIDVIFKDVVDFSGVGNFLDMPIKHYSSGMRVRLAFSVAAHLDPDILLLDEVLAVGDMAFQNKCLQRVEGLTSGGRTIVFVSHSLGHILHFCDRVVWLDQGQIRFDGEVTAGVKLYEDANSPKKCESIGNVSVSQNRKGTRSVLYKEIEVLDGNFQPCNAVATGQDIYISLKYERQLPLSSSATDVCACIVITNEKGQRLFGLPSEILPIKLPQIEDSGFLVCKVHRLPLVPGSYEITVSLLIDRQLTDKITNAAKLLVMEGDYYGTGNLPLSSFGEICVDFEWSHQTQPPFIS